MCPMLNLKFCTMVSAHHSIAHNIANGFAWGPDGWLYGTHGRTNWSMLGKPGTPEAERVRFDGGVYRYHPVRRVWEPFADGTTNPWGIDWDDWGQAFVCNCVNPHLFHVIQGAHYEPWRNRASSLHAYQRIDTIADHLHFLGGTNKIRDKLGSAEELSAGGGHAHCGMMVYLGDNWPASYRNGIFMNNIHGKRMNHDVPTRRGSGYTASHAPDVMMSKDPWFMGVTLRYGPDGGVFVSDWSDTGECHSTKNTRKQTGRIFKITYGTPKQTELNLESATDARLVELQLHRNDWWVRHSRRLLQERAAAGRDMTAVHAALNKMLQHPAVTRRLRALWALHVTGGADEALLGSLLSDPDEHLRAWAIRLLCETGPPPVERLQVMAQMAVDDSSTLVRLHLACALQRLPLTQRWAIAHGLVAHAADSEDSNLPLMIWYGIEPLVAVDPERFVQLAAQSKIPLIRQHVARRVAAASR